MAASQRTVVEIGDRLLTVSNLDKVLYADGTTKGQVIDYYARAAAVMLPHIRDRAVTMTRYPDGPDGKSFFEKRCPDHHPDWMPTGTHRIDADRAIDHCLFTEQAALVWAANLAALELHTPMHRVTSADAPDLVVFDLDPGPGTDVLTCCQVAQSIAGLLDQLGLRSVAKTSGSKGMQLYVPVRGVERYGDTRDFALAIAQLLEKRQPDRVTSNMNKAVRPNRIFIDWSQNTTHKTTISVYSLRPRERPTVSTPITWDEINDATTIEDLTFTASDVLDRIATSGDPFAEAATGIDQELPRLA